jgi:lipopolysaccharide export system protein LptA
LSLLVLVQGALIAAMPKAIAATSSAEPASSPTGTLLLPLTPKLDTSPARPANNAGEGIDSATEKKAEIEEGVSDGSQASGKSIGDAEELLPTLETMSAEKGKVDDQQDTLNGSVSSDDTTLKGTIQIVADDTEFDQDKNTFLGTGNAIAVIGGQDSKLTADTILYDQNDQTIDARGNVRILRNGQLTTGTAFKFKVTSDEYLITKPDTELQGSQIIARQGYGSTKNGLVFRNGTMSMPAPFFFSKNVNNGPISYREGTMQQKYHAESYLPEHPSFRFKARKMVYERYKETDNLTVYGGRVEMGDFNIPLGKFVCTVGQTETKAVFPTTPYVGSNFNMGGISVGPQFNTGIGKDSVLSWSPMVMFGGRNLQTNANTGGVGLAGRVGVDSKNFRAHLAYGSTSNLLVGDIKAKIWRSVRLQAGINRFLDDGMFGLTRARLMAEIKDTHQYFDIPYISQLQLRTSAGWAQDNPLLVNTSTTNAQLHGNPTSTVMHSGYRVQEQITVMSHPYFSVGDDRYGAKSYLFGGVAARGYTTGDANLITQAGPTLDVHCNRLRLLTGYNVAGVRGQSPFVFDQFTQGNQSYYLMGDVKVTDFLTLGGIYGYNLTQKLPYSKQIQAAIGPSDVKLLVGYDYVLNNYKVGFNVLHGEPIPFDKLVLKGNPDQGQLGGI